MAVSMIPGTGYALPGNAGSAPAAVTAPAATVDPVAANGTPTNHTFGAFLDPDSRINSYQVAIVNSSGVTTILSGTGLGAYAVANFANGDGYTLTLTALDIAGNPLATATHTVTIDTVPGAPVFTPRQSFDFTTNTAVGSRSTAGTSTIYEADGVTVKAQAIVYSNNATGTWGPSWGTNEGIIMLGPTGGGAGFCVPLDMSASLPANSVWLITLRGKIIVPDPGGPSVLAYGTTANLASNSNAGMRADYGATTNTTASFRWQGGAGTNGTNQNTKTSTATPFFLVQIQLSRGQMPNIVWRQDATEQAAPTALAVRDGVNWFGEFPGSAALSAATTVAPVFSTVSPFVILNASTGATQQFALRKIDTASLGLP